MQKKGANISLKGYDDIFSTDQSRAEAQQERVQEIPLSELHPFEGHPFRVVDDEEMMKTAESVRDFGVLTPAIVRPDPDGGYEIVSGHRRHRASELAGKETMPAIVRDLDDDAAIILMVDANLQRETILPSERAFAYKMKLDAIKHQGERTDLTSAQVGQKSWAVNQVAEQSGDSEKYLGNTAGMDIAFRNLIYDYYSKDLSKKVKSAMRTKQRNGGYITCCTYGYKVSPKNKHQMIIDPETAPIVRRIFTDVIAGKSTSQVARELNAEGILTPQQYKGVARRKDSPSKALWTHNRILDMLKNVKYTGCMVNHTRESMVIRAKSQRRVPKEDWIYHENAHEAIVTTEEFEAAQAALRKVRPHTKKNKENSFPFYCAHCGRKLQRTFGTDVHFYCVTPYWDTDEEPCKSVRWDRTDIEEVVLAALKAQIAVMTVETVGKIQNTTSEGTLLRQRLKVLVSELESGDTQKVQSYLDYREGRITKEEFITLRSEREKRMEELKNLIAETEVAYEDFLEKENQAKQEQAIVERTSSMNDEALKELMYDAVERINVTDNQNIEIIWKFDDLFATA